MQRTREFYRSLPAKRMAAGALFFNETGQFMLVEPTYKPTWEIPGGVVEADESPLSAVVREVHEELGLAIPTEEFSFALLEYTPAEGIKTDQLMFVFDGGIMNEKRQSEIRLNPPELKSFLFVELPAARRLLKPSMAVRIARSLEAIREGRATYDETGTDPNPFYLNDNDLVG